MDCGLARGETKVLVYCMHVHLTTTLSATSNLQCYLKRAVHTNWVSLLHIKGLWKLYSRGGWPVNGSATEVVLALLAILRRVDFTRTTTSYVWTVTGKSISVRPKYCSSIKLLSSNENKSVTTRSTFDKGNHSKVQ